MDTKTDVLQILYDNGIHDTEMYNLAEIADDIERVYIKAVNEMEVARTKRIKRDISRFKIKVLRLKMGAYCVECNKYYTFEEWDALPAERIYPQYMASRHVCECGSKSWTCIG
jgi:uncharacterized protein YtpQ (UPF0354 family)